MSATTNIASCVVLAVLLGATAGWAQPAAIDREISALSANLYRVRVDTRHTVFLVAPQGIVLVDPLSFDTTQWLQKEFATRWPGRSVRYVLHTVHHVSRSEGGGTFRDSAEIVGHRTFNEQLSRARRGTGRTYARVRDGETHFDEERAIAIDGQTIHAVHAALPDLPENTVIVFPSERMAFAANAPFADVTPFRFAGVNPRAVNRWLAIVTSLDFDVLLLGDGRSIRKMELEKLSAYVDTLIDRAAAAYEAGRSTTEFNETTLPATYRGDVMFGNWRNHLAAARDDVALFRVDATIGAFANYVLRDNAFCAGYTTCASGGVVPGGVTSVVVSAARMSFVAETAVTTDAFSSRGSVFHDQEFALRETRFSGLVGVNMPAGAAGMRILGGVSHTIAERRGVDRIKLGLAPFAGRHPSAGRDSRFALTGGFDLIVGRRVGLVLPLRVTYAFEEARDTWPSVFDAQAGIGVSIRLLRSIR